MFMNGVGIGMLVTVVIVRPTLVDRRVGLTALFVVAAGAIDLLIAALLIVTAATLLVAAAALGSALAGLQIE